MYFDTQAKVIYEPKPLGDYTFDELWYVILEVEKDVGKYLRQLYFYDRYKTKKLQRSGWGDHITIVRAEKPVADKMKFWKRHAGREFHIRVFLNPRTNGLHWWTPIYSEAALVLRQELGLPREPEVPFHLTFGTEIGVERAS